MKLFISAKHAHGNFGPKVSKEQIPEISSYVLHSKYLCLRIENTFYYNEMGDWQPGVWTLNGHVTNNLHRLYQAGTTICFVQD